MLLSNMGRAVALQLWQLGAIKVNFEKPFRLVSGNYSPIYVNCRSLMGSPFFVDLFSATLRLLVEVHKIRFDVIAGGETAGIPFAAFSARAFGLPMVYVRKEAKEHGVPSRVEGVLNSGAQVLLVEDLITDAGSKISFIQGIQAVGGVVRDVVVIFDRLQGGSQALAGVGIRLHSMTDMNKAIFEAGEGKLLSAKELDLLHLYLENPADWHHRQSLPFNA
jgi:orotate phosphoribosyltransferase